MRKHLLSWFTVSTFCVCALALTSYISPAGAQDKAAKALIAVDDAWSNAAVARNVDAVASFYAEDGVAYPPSEPVAVGRAAARKVWAAYFADPTFQISWKATSAGVESRTGWTVGTYQASVKGSDGKTNVEKGKYVTVWRKGADSKWKAIHDMWNSDAK
jgi:ketosteroid isomerase-like protein